MEADMLSDSKVDEVRWIEHNWQPSGLALNPNPATG